ncbi:ATP-binding protein [Actinomadura sp. 7K534]|nr:ATP-binding protein [Actinomadura sp. 7K534]
MLYGREKEQTEIDRLLGVVHGGGSGAVHIWGEPGIGKSALLDCLLVATRRRPGRLECRPRSLAKLRAYPAHHGHFA